MTSPAFPPPDLWWRADRDAFLAHLAPMVVARSAVEVVVLARAVGPNVYAGLVPPTHIRMWEGTQKFLPVGAPPGAFPRVVVAPQRHIGDQRVTRCVLAPVDLADLWNALREGVPADVAAPLAAVFDAPDEALAGLCDVVNVTGSPTALRAAARHLLGLDP